VRCRSGGTARGLLASSLLILSLVVGDVCEASQESEMLYSKGLLEFHADRFEPALALFQQAVQADPADVYALYYRGVTRGRLGDLDGAIADLRVVVERKPELKEVLLELGVALVDAGRETEAIPWLEQAQRVPELEAKASLFLGVAQLRVGQESAAEVKLERAASADPSLGAASLYYRGVSAYQAGRWEEAERRFGRVRAMSPSSQLGREAAEFLAVVEARGGRAFRLFADVGLQYDSNVTIGPDDDSLKTGISEEDDGLGVLSAGATYAPLRTQQALVNVGYEFFQSLYFHLTEFNLQNHRANAEVVGAVGNARLGLLGRYDYYSLDVKNFLQEATANPWFTLFHGAIARLDLWYRMRYRDFLDSDYELRSGFNHSPGIRHAFNLGDWSRFIAFGYRYDHEAPDESNDTARAFGYDGHEVSAGLAWSFPADVWGDVGYAYRRERYFAESDGRRDNEHRILAGLGKQLIEPLAIRLDYLGTINDSNQSVFQYNRHIVSVSLEARY